MLPEITKILFANDLSKNSLHAFGYAIQVARQFQATVTVLHVAEAAAGALGDWVKEKAEEEELTHSVETIRDQLKKFCDAVDPNRTCIELVSDILVRVGEPVEEILSAAEEEGFNLIVVGHCGKGFLKNAVMGSVSRKVVERSSRPVIVVPLPDEKLNWEELV